MKKGFHCFNNRGLKATEFNPFKLQMGKLRFREGKRPASGHIASQWLSRDSNPGLLVPRAEFFSRAFLGWFSGAATLKAREAGRCVRHWARLPPILHPLAGTLPVAVPLRWFQDM